MHSSICFCIYLFVPYTFMHIHFIHTHILYIIHHTYIIYTVSYTLYTLNIYTILYRCTRFRHTMHSQTRRQARHILPQEPATDLYLEHPLGHPHRRTYIEVEESPFFQRPLCYESKVRAEYSVCYYILYVMLYSLHGYLNSTSPMLTHISVIIYI